MAKQIDMLGKRFGRLVAKQETGKDGHGFRYLFVCDCGNTKDLSGAAVRKGVTKSCGCLRSEVTAAKNFVHGLSATSKYRSAVARTVNLKRKQRTPSWANKEAIRQFYLNKPEGCHVDHIIPLNGKNVSGLHVESNLQYLSIEENRRKSNSYSLAR